MMAVTPADFPTFRLFLRAYWNQNGDTVYGTLQNALQTFASDASKTGEATEYFSKLLLEMREVRSRGFALKLDGIETPDVLRFWNEAGGRGLCAADFLCVENFLRKSLSV